MERASTSQQNPQSAHQSQKIIKEDKKSKLSILILGIILAFLLGIGTMYAWQNYAKLQQVSKFSPRPLASSTPESSGESDMSLFSDSPHKGSLDTSGDSTIIRKRFVNINFDLLDEDLVMLNLFNDVVFTAVLDRMESKPIRWLSWIGHLEGVEYSQVTLVVKDGIMSGNITLTGEFYQVRYAGNGVHAIYEIDQSAFPPD